MSTLTVINTQLNVLVTITKSHAMYMNSYRVALFFSKYVLNVVQVGISPVELVSGVIYCDSIRPFQLRRNDNGFVLAIHANSANVWHVSPVCPVNVPVEVKRKL